MTADRLKTEQAELSRDISYLQDCIGSMTPDNIRAVRNAVEAAIVAAQGGGKGEYRTYRATVEDGYDPAEVAREFCESRDSSWHSAVRGDGSGTVCFDVPSGNDLELSALMVNSKIVQNSLTRVNV